jgi:hypothetical protein
MHPKIKRRPRSAAGAIRVVKPLVLHDVTNGPGHPGRRLRLPAMPAGSGPANHARHHVARQAQA